MPYVEKLKTIREDKDLTYAEIAKLGNIPLATVTRVFNGQTLNPTFETITGIAMGMGVSLDELAGLKQPDEQPLASPIIDTINSCSELLKEKDIQINQLHEEKAALRKEKDIQINQLIEDKNMLRKEKYGIFGVLVVFILALVILLIVDINHGHFGYFQY